MSERQQFTDRAQPSIPRFAAWLMQLILPQDRTDDVVGDIEELHRRRVLRFGSLFAWVITNIAVLFIALAFLLIRLREHDFELRFLSKLELLLTLRLMRKQPVLSATAIGSLAVGIAVAAMGFTMIDAAVNSELDVEKGERFVRFNVRTEKGESSALALAHLRILRGQSEQFDHLGVVDVQRSNVRHGSGAVETLVTSGITPESLTYVPPIPILGRPLTTADVAPDASAVAMIREGVWHRSYGASPRALGETVTFHGTQYEIVGVVPDRYQFPAGGDIWFPIATGGHIEDTKTVSLFGILAPGATSESAQQEINTLVNTDTVATTNAAGITEQERLAVEVVGYTALPGPLGIMGLIGILVPTLLVLVIAANIANLVQARTASRTKELGLRTVLGAPRSRLVGQLSLEAVVMGSLAAVLGLAIAVIGLRWIGDAMNEAPFWVDFSAKPKTFAFAAGLALVITAVCGIAPAFRATRRDVNSVLATNAPTFDVSRLGAAMMVTQMALSIALLSGALVMAQSLFSAANADLDLPDQRVLTAQITRPETQSMRPAPLRVAEAAAELPGVIASGTADHLPRYDAPAFTIELENESGRSDQIRGVATRVLASHGFLESLEARVLAGRLLEETDYPESRSDFAAATAMQPTVHPTVQPTVQPSVQPVVVNEPFVRRFFAGVAPGTAKDSGPVRSRVLGKRFRVSNDSSNTSPHSAQSRPAQEPWLEIVGVVPDLGLGGGAEEYAAGYYQPGYTDRRYFYLSLLAEADPSSLGQALRQHLMNLDPELVVTRVQPLGLVNAEERNFQAGFGATLTAVGVLALVLSMLGLYAMISFSISQRTREIGVRVALGAGALQVIRAVMSRAGVNLLLGAGFGLALGAAFLRVQQQALAARLPSEEPWILPAVLAAFATAGVAACLVPALRVLRISPTEALKDET